MLPLICNQPIAQEFTHSLYFFKSTHAQFIEITDVGSSSKVLLNTSYIVRISENNGGTYIVRRPDDGSEGCFSVRVSESYAVLKKALGQ